MNPAKLRRSRDVSEIQRSKIEKGFRISDLALLNMAFCFGSYRQESARQTSDVIAKLLISNRPRISKRSHISSGRPPTACPAMGVCPL
jgi:hypothetical protein